MEPSREVKREHIPVMAAEVLSLLNVRPDGIYLDGTIGSGGHAKQILPRLTRHGRIIGIDLDEEALDICRQNLRASSSVSLYHGSYADFPTFISQEGVSAMSGFLLDLGLSSRQLADPDRGFSYQIDGPLDMRFDPAVGIPAAALIRNSTEKELTRIFQEFGEERYARAIARAVKRAPRMETGADLKEAIRRSTPPARRDRTYARVFQALRIAVNRELENLKTFLNRFITFLEPGGRVVILSYHSLEDRLVKHTFRTLQAAGELTLLTKKPLRPTPEEIDRNPRARSARLRAGERPA
jgi:16S rRNA (cytosine1402-N4)-methyltransferase